MAFSPDRRSVVRGALAVAAGVFAGLVLLSGGAQAYDWARTMNQGATGADVMELQVRVWRAGPPIPRPSPG